MASIRRRGDKWQVQVRRSGQQPVARTFHTKKDAETWARQMEVLADKKELPLKPPRELGQTTLGDLVERYCDSISPRKRGYDSERWVLKAFLREPICNRRLCAITSQDFAAYRDTRLGEVRPATVKRQLATLRHIFEVAVREWALPLDVNPLATIQTLKADARRERRLRGGEWEQLIEAARSRQNPYIQLIMRLALATAMRRGEILAMAWDHLDLHKRCLLIPNSKNGLARTIPLTREAVLVLSQAQAIEATYPYVFPLSANAFRLAWERVKRQAGVADLRFHDLRHEAISRLFEAGLSVPEVALISGHRDLRMLFRYTHPIRQRILEKLDD
jgi:integrase